MGAAAAIPMVASAGLSLASMGMKAGSDVMAGQAKSQELQVKAQNYLLDASTKATNYELQGTAAAANARYQGEAQKEQFGITSSQDLMQASEADTAAKFGDLRAAMTDAGAREGLASTLGNIATIRAAGGVDLSSPDTQALMGHATKVAELNRTASEASINAQTAAERAGADYLRQASAFALTQGAKAGAMGEYNAKVAETFADFNKTSALTYGAYNAEAAKSAAGTAETMGFMNAGGDILGGLGKAFGAGGFGLGGASPSGGSAAP